jgi:hypothetical protein
MLTDTHKETRKAITTALPHQHNQGDKDFLHIDCQQVKKLHPPL